LRKKKPYHATLEEVIITREGDTAVIAYLNPDVAVTDFRIGPEIETMTEGEIIDLFNQTIDARELSAAMYHHVAIEVPVGQPQIEYFAEGNQWTPRGDVLRCIIEGDGLDNEEFVYIDDQPLTLREFGKLLSTYSGWGMRITFVPDDRLEDEPEIDIREPD